METMIVSLIVAGAVFLAVRTLRKDLDGGNCGCSGGGCGGPDKKRRSGGAHEH